MFSNFNLSELTGSPALAGGVVKGDAIIAVDGTKVLTTSPKMSVDDVAALLRGPPGTSVGLVVRRSDASEVNFYFFCCSPWLTHLR